MNLKQLFCGHEWTLLSKDVLPSQAEILHQMGKSPNTHTSFTQKLIIHQLCPKCKLQRFKTFKSA